jgi:hypothetical protein
MNKINKLAKVILSEIQDDLHVKVVEDTEYTIAILYTEEREIIFHLQLDKFYLNRSDYWALFITDNLPTYSLLLSSLPPKEFYELMEEFSKLILPYFSEVLDPEDISSIRVAEVRHEKTTVYYNLK